MIYINCTVNRHTIQNNVPYYPVYNTHFYTPGYLCQGGGAYYQRVHKLKLFYIDAMGEGTCRTRLKMVTSAVSH